MERVKKWLKRAYKKELEIRVLKEDYLSTKSLIFSLSNFTDDARVQRSPVANIREESILKCIEYGEQLTNRIAQLYDIKLEIETLISNIENADRRILLRMRYLNYKAWAEIGYELGFSMRAIHYIHGKALQDAKDLCAPLHIKL